MSVAMGVFVGGQSRRMGSDKGHLRAPGGGTLLSRWLGVAAELSLDVVLVGQRRAYEDAGVVALADDPAGVGPLGGLAALLAHAALSGRRALAVAVDMPFVDADDVRALLSTDASIAAPRRDGRWEPLFASYDPERVLPVVRRRIERGALSLQGLLEEIGATEVAVRADHLDDWDRPADVDAPRPTKSS